VTMTLLQTIFVVINFYSLLVLSQNQDELLMVIGGNVDSFGDYFSTVELVSLDPSNNPVPECIKSLADIPIQTGVSLASVGLSSDGYPLLCGGQASWADTLSSCYVYIPSNDSWVLTGYMNNPKGGSAYGTSAVHGFTIAGGYSTDSVILDNVDTTFDGISFSDQTPLHDGTERPCLSFIDENRFIIAGGVTNGLASSGAFLHNLLDGTTTRLPDMTFPTTGHSCGFVVPEDGSSPRFVVAGGTELPPFGTVQIYYIEDDSWLLGSPFFDIVGAASVPYKNSFLMVGGYSYEVDGDYIDLVHYYDPESKSIIPLEGRLQTKKGEVAALLVNRSIFPECNSY